MTKETSSNPSNETILETLGESKSPKGVRTKVVDESAFPRGLDEKGLQNARHAATFPPNTPHSVINAFEGHVDTDTVGYADPRNAEKVVDLRAPKKTEVVVSPRLTNAQRGSVSSESSDKVIVETVTP
jgi:hypothetical protein